MNYIVLDLEWNGAYSKRAHGYFNEIIEIGAVRLDEQLRAVDTFHTVLKPVVSVKLSKIVQGMTSITAEELEQDGMSFADAMAALTAFSGRDAALLTWSNTDLLVLIENYRFFRHMERVPFVAYYADVQPYCQQRMGADTKNQMALAKACELAGVPEDNLEHHRALDDSRLTARLLQKLYEPESFRAILHPADSTFYQRLTFKVSYISSLNDPAVDAQQLRFDCPLCGHSLRRKKAWRFRSRAFCNELYCRGCDKLFAARVQYKRTFDGVELQRKICEKLPVPQQAEEETNVTE